MAKGSVRKKGKKWYYRFYVEDESGNRIQKELPGTESKSETESLLRKAMEEYENQVYTAKTANVTLGEMLDMWIEEELKPSSRSNGTLRSYLNTINRIKSYPISKRKLKTITVEHLQTFFDLLATGGSNDKGKEIKGLMHGTRHVYGAVLRGAFSFAVFPKKLISFNPMQYVVNRNANDDYELFTETRTEQVSVTKTISEKQYSQMIEILAAKNNPAVLPIQIAYYAGLRLGEVCSLTWQDIDFDEQYITVRRSICYSNTLKKTILGPTKRKKVRTVYFGSTLLQILKDARGQQLKNEQQYGNLYLRNYYKVVQDKNRSYHEVYSFPVTEKNAEHYTEIDFVCLRPDGTYEAPRTVNNMCISARKQIEGMEDFHFHTLRHTYTSRLLASGAAPKDVQELLGHSDINTTLNIHAHASNESKKKSAMLLD